MATELPGLDLSMTVGSDLSAKQFYLVKLSAARTVALASAAADAVIGVLQDKPAASGRAALVRVHGLSKVVAGGTIAAGDRLTSDTAGKAIVQAASAGVNNGIVGIAVEAAVASDIFTAFINPHSYQGA